MILPVYAYGQPVLKRKALPVDPEDPSLPVLLENMWETMYHASGVGLAAPQIGKSLRIFLVDTAQLEEEDGTPKRDGIKVAFLNAEKLSEAGDEWPYEEGCLSIPHIRGEVQRPQTVRLRYQTLDGATEERTFDGINARVIQHEYDHIEGELFVDKLKPLRRRLITKKLEKIRRGQVQADYRLKFPVLR